MTVILHDDETTARIIQSLAVDANLGRIRIVGVLEQLYERCGIATDEQLSKLAEQVRVVFGEGAVF